MSSDPKETAAWRAFGMLDADESASYDESLRSDPEFAQAFREIEILTAAVAVATTPPITPRDGQLERLQARLGLQEKKKRVNWLGISGWAAAAALAMAMILNRQPSNKESLAFQNTSSVPEIPSTELPISPITRPATDDLTNPNSENVNALDARIATSKSGDESILKLETNRLSQEIAILRDELKAFQQRSEASPDVAWPIIMRMRSPREVATTTNPDGSAKPKDSPITELLGDAITAANNNPAPADATSPPPATTLIPSVANEDDSDGPTIAQTTVSPPTRGAVPSDTDTLPEPTDSNVVPPANHVSPPIVKDPPQKSIDPPPNDPAPEKTPPAPSAIPIYDPARDIGTLVVSNLPPLRNGETYNLWVTPKEGGASVYVGSIPVTQTSGAESFDFSFGSTGIIPGNFTLTRDFRGQTNQPSIRNTVLQGPR
ncbi:MAG: hypothetical protein HC845_02020 [Akkermansiaceae bacterium]|nr:hypothetical protein [Akkermansiaceae bacterium]